MTEQKNPMYYVDPNSGSAPQPGGSAGFAEETDEVSEVILDHVEAIKAEQKAQEDRENLEPDEVEPQDVPEHPVGLVDNEDDTSDEDKDEDEDKTEEPVDPEAVVPTPGDVAPADVPVFTSQSEGLDDNTSDQADASESTESTEAPENTETAPTEVVEAPVEAYDPSKYNSAEVLLYIEEHPEEREAILAAESEGRKRKAVLSA